MGCSFKRQKGVTIIDAFPKILDDSKKKIDR